MKHVHNRTGIGSEQDLNRAGTGSLSASDFLAFKHHVTDKEAVSTHKLKVSPGVNVQISLSLSSKLSVTRPV